MRVWAAYQARLAEGALKADPAQADIALKLDRLARELEAHVPRANGLLGRLLSTAAGAAPKGLYLWGPVGRGKTVLMDLLFDAIEVAPKRRAHFHAFMQDVHRRIHAARRNNSANGAIAEVARAIAGEARLLCLDEMQIGDIADAMILGRLFAELFARGTVLAATGNLHPDDLYKDGLNRPLFLPFIRLLHERLDIARLDGPADYRLGRIKAHETFITPLGPEADRRVQGLWERLTETERGVAVALALDGRALPVPQAARGAARFSFADLCAAPLGPPDYLALARSFGTVFVERIPALSRGDRNEAKRLILLIDTLYDARAHLVASSEKPPADIYPEGDHALEFARTASRLEEMRSASWWGARIAET